MNQLTVSPYGEVTKGLIDLCNKTATETAQFTEKLGPGKGDHATTTFLKKLTEKIRENQYLYSKITPEYYIYPNSNSRFDFYIECESTVVEIALSLKNPTTEFEKDVLKVLISNQKNVNLTPIKNLLFLGKSGAKAKCEEPFRKAAICWAKNAHELNIFVEDIDHQRCLNT